MNAVARPWIGLVFKCLSLLALIFAIIFFMRMQEERAENDRLRTFGVVSRALVTDKQVDKTVFAGRRGNTRTVEYQLLHVRHFPKSQVKYADFPDRVREADLPVSLPLTGELLVDSASSGVVFVPKSIYEETQVGDMLTVVNTPWNRNAPTLVTEVEAFDGDIYYPRIAAALVLMLLFWLIGWRISRASATRGAAEIVAAPGSMS